VPMYFDGCPDCLFTDWGCAMLDEAHAPSWNVVE
jgi:hypothetical protein